MVRTQIQLTEAQQGALRRLSDTTGRSIADLIRESVDRMISRQVLPDRDAQIKRAIRLAGRFSSGATDVGAEHDRHLAEAFR
jgi:hypothetical protein